MKNIFIKLRFDRMKNGDIHALCNWLMVVFGLFDAKALDLEQTFARFKELETSLTHLNPKKRKLSQTEELKALRKRQDDLVTALLLHTKALKRANFKDYEQDVNFCYKVTLSIFKNYIHEDISNKASKMHDFKGRLGLRTEYYSGFEKMGLLRYADALETIETQIDKQTRERKKEKEARPPVGIALPTKEHAIEELRLLLNSIEIKHLTQSATDYKPLISLINGYLKESRGQLRNLASRRKTAKEKLERNKEE
jgi:hypothetical protein